MKKSTKFRNKLIFQINYKYKNYLKTICKDIVLKYFGLPINWEDIYYEFLYEVPRIISEYQSNKNVPFEKYLGIKCRFFARNMCKKFTRQKYKVLNESIAADKIMFLISDKNSSIELLDYNCFSPIEMQIIEDFFINGNNIAHISRNLKISSYKIKKKIDEIKQKLKKQL